MRRQEVYDIWNKAREQIDVKEDFTDKVMNQIFLYEQKKSKTFFDYRRFVDLISANLTAQAAFVVVGAVVGLTRVVFMFAVILGY